ncbi:hypothetical protein MRBLWO14_003143 [Microbacterium sp. LWO14-1.2]|uniref:hypothetical protein n=1 Tax=Microbacterium sp. LWO14-1.2 TaxID=3135263 RepID=UPI003139BDCC
MANTLTADDVRVGYIDTPDLEEASVAAALVSDHAGALLRIPYVRNPNAPGTGRFSTVSQWFHHNESAIPSTIIFTDARGSVTLNGVRFAGSSGGAVDEGRLRARTVIFNNPRTFQDEYRVGQVTSMIDGLQEFAGFRPVSLDVTRVDNRNRVTVVVEADEHVDWEVDDVAYEVSANASWEGQEGTRFTIHNAAPLLTTTIRNGATPAEHLQAQRPIRALLILAHGRALFWRQHLLRDEEFPTWMMAGEPQAASSVPVQLAATVREAERTPTPDRDLVSPLLSLSDVGPDGMSRWVRLYGEDNFRRAVEPVVEVLNGATKFLEPQLMMLAISLDRFGAHSFADGRQRRLSQTILRCIERANLDWPSIGPRVGIAKALANMNNDLKHPDRGSYPDGDALAVMVDLAKVIARAQLFPLLAVPDERRESFFGWGDAGSAVRAFGAAGITVDEAGAIHRRASSSD